ncbi:HORMA domain-containing protein, partial [Vararia minispora EC-137]
QQNITAHQSIACVQTLLKAGLGCIAYLRDLLPQDNFTYSYLTASGSKSHPPSVFDASASPPNSQGSASGFKVMTVSRGWSLEADKLLDFVEKGIYEALEKSYLKSFIFAIYLDEEDPNNIVEAYTFNFQYYKVPGTDTAIPIMSLGEDLNKLSLNNLEVTDPVARAISESRLPTLGDVKKSLKTLVKRLISAVNQMDRLPTRKFVTFKLFYYPHTPFNYEPPCFVAGDSDRDRFFFTTHRTNEVPEKWSIGKMETGHHSVDVHITSVSAFIPTHEQDDLPFTGLSDQPSTFATAFSTKRAEAEAQKRDARERCVVWDAERISRMDSADLDANGEPDPDYPENSNGSDNMLGPWLPHGMRRDDGEIVPMSKELKGLDVMEVDEVGGTLEIVYGGHTEDASQYLNEQASGFSSTPSDELQGQGADYEQTQRMDHVGDNRPASPSTVSSLPPSDEFSHTTDKFPASQKKSGIPDRSPTESLHGRIERYRFKTGEQVTPTKDRQTSVEPSHIESDKMNCACRVQVRMDELDSIFCDQCHTWHHIWFVFIHLRLRFHSRQDQRIPQKFICFKCTFENDESYDYISLQSWYSNMMSNYENLTLLRRAIKLTEESNPESKQAFTKLLGCEGIVAGNLFKRLEQEGFIALQSDMEAVDGKKIRADGKSNKKKSRKNLRRARYVFVRTVRRSALYADYFNPDRAVEMRMLGMENMVRIS